MSTADASPNDVPVEDEYLSVDEVVHLRGILRERAKKLLVRLEKHAGDAPSPQLGLFAKPDCADSESEAESEAESSADPLREALAAIDPDALSPRDALALLYRLKDVADEEEPG